MDQPQESQVHKQRPGMTAGIVLIILGALFLLQNILPDFHFGDYWPLILIAIGVALLFKGKRKT